jgi:phosphate transport system substrate-binding protein
MSNSRGQFILHVPRKYRTFVLSFADTNDLYWPKRTSVTPTADPTALGRVELDSQQDALNAGERGEVEEIRNMLARSDPDVAQAIAESLRAPTQSAKAALVGVGPAAVSPLYVNWVADYARATGIHIDYQGAGSGGGIEQIAAHTVAFSNSVVPLKAYELQQHDLLQVPSFLDAVVPVIALHGIDAANIVMDGRTLAEIFLGRIKMWNDPRIRKLNPTLALPDRAINPVHRTDVSEATYVFSNYLAQSDGAFKEIVGTGSSVSWPVGPGAKGDEGVAHLSVREGSVGYVTYSYATQHHLNYGKLVNESGRVVDATTGSIQAAAMEVDWAQSAAGELTLVNRPGESAWPAVGAVYTVIPRATQNATVSLRAVNFIKWTYANGDRAMASLNYVPLPETAKRAVVTGLGRASGIQGESRKH